MAALSRSFCIWAWGIVNIWQSSLSWKAGSRGLWYRWKPWTIMQELLHMRKLSFLAYVLFALGQYFVQYFQSVFFQCEKAWQPNGWQSLYKKISVLWDRGSHIPLTFHPEKLTYLQELEQPAKTNKKKPTKKANFSLSTYTWACGWMYTLMFPSCQIIHMPKSTFFCTLCLIVSLPYSGWRH